MNTIQAAIAQLIEGQDLNDEQMQGAFKQIMRGEATASQIAGLLIALRIKGETVTELTGAVKVLRAFAVPVNINEPVLVDIVGTGGDASNTFNVSTTSAIVAASAGVKIAKHGSVAVSSRCGSANLLQAAGVNLKLSPLAIKTCVKQIGIGFMFAPLHHSAMQYAREVRGELAVRTLFNLLGPLTNPAQAKRLLIGVFARQWLRPLAQVMQNLGAEQVMVVHSTDGLDEISVSSKTWVAELKQNTIEEYTLSPGQFGLKTHPLKSLMVSSAQESLRLMQSILNNESPAGRDIVIFNAGAAIYLAGITDNLSAGIKRAHQAITSGAAKAKLAALIKLSNELRQT